MRYMQAWWAVVVAAMVGLTGCDGGGGGGGSHDFGDNDPNVVSAMGDSITEGSGVTPYTSILAGMTGKTVINHGSGGATAGDGAGRISGVLASDKPGYVLIFYGANDVISGVGMDATIGALGAIVDACKANHSVPVLATILPMQAVHEMFDGAGQELNRRIRSLGSEKGVKVVNLEGEFGRPSDLLQDDGLHPTEAGSVVIADSFAGAID